jgi:hypothetical protein
VSFLCRSHRENRARWSSEHFSVDRTLLEAWASMKSFRPKDGSGDPPTPGAQQQALHFALRQHRGKELLRHLAREQPVAVLREYRGFPYRVLNAQSDKPAEQQIVINPLDQLPLRADRIEGLRQQRPPSAAPAGSSRAQSANGALRIRQSVPPAPRSGSRESPATDDPPEPLLQVYVAEKATANLIVAAHRHLLPRFSGAQSANLATFFQQPG